MTELTQRLLLQFQESLHSKNRQPATVESYGRDAQDFLRFIEQNHLAIDSVEPQTIIWFRDHLLYESHEAENSVRRKVIGVRQFYRFLQDSRHISDSPFENVPLPERDDDLRDSVDEQKLGLLLTKLPCDNFKHARDHAILHLLAFEGIKAHELIDLQWNGFIQTSKSATLTIPGSKARTISLNDDSAASLTLYKQTYSHWLDLQSLESQARYLWMFVAFKGKDSGLVLPHMSRHGLKFMLSELGERFRIESLHTEGLRHHAIQYQLNQGKDAEAVMSHLGLRSLGNVGKHLAKRRMES